MPFLRLYGINVRSRPAAIALAAAALAVGAVFVAFGIVLLLGLAAVGIVVGAGVMIFRSLTGRGVGRLHPTRDIDLDPELEVHRSVSAAQPPPHKLTSPQGHKP
jgi:uncharacterized protein (DUF58 family)